MTTKQTKVLDGDVFRTRGEARAVAALLRARGWKAVVESSAGEHRVRVNRDGMSAYFYEGDHVDTFQPRWV